MKQSNIHIWNLSISLILSVYTQYTAESETSEMKLSYHLNFLFVCLLPGHEFLMPWFLFSDTGHTHVSWINTAHGWGISTVWLSSPVFLFVSSGLICDTQSTSCFADHAVTMTPYYSVADPLAKVHWINISFLLKQFHNYIFLLRSIFVSLVDKQIIKKIYCFSK